MPKATKFILVFATVSLLVGITLVCIGAVFGGARVVNFSLPGGWRIYNGELTAFEDFSYKANEPVSRIKVTADAAQVYLIEGDHFFVDGNYDPNYWDLSFMEIDGLMTVELRAKPNFPYPLDFPLNPDYHAELCVYYASDRLIQSVEINCNAANVLVGHLVSENVSFSFNAVLANIDSINCKNFKLEMNAGNANFVELKATQSAKMTMNAGSMVFDKVDLNKLDLTMNAGYIDLSGCLSGSNVINAAAGSLDMRLDQKASELYFICKVELGDLNINGSRVSGLSSGTSIGSASAPTKVDLKVQVGTVSISTR